MVFSKQWFADHQASLLYFANTRHGRRILRIDGNRSAVGGQHITRIEPHAITWKNSDGTFTCEVGTDSRYASRLFSAYKPFWYAAHAWDTTIANRLAPRLNVGFDTLTSYPNTGSAGLTIDGYVTRTVDKLGESFSTIRSGSGTDSYSTDGMIYAELDASNATNSYARLARSILTFDTSSIPATSVVTAASLSLHSTNKYAGLGQTPVHVVAANPNQANVLSSADYQRLGSTSFGLISYSLMVTGATNTWSLNSAGVASINPGSISSFGVRLEWDLNNSFTGSWVSFDSTYYSWTSADGGGTSSGPALLVTYTSVRDSSISGTARLGGTVQATTTHFGGIAGKFALGGTITVQKDIAPVAGKDYVYRVYDQTGVYIGVWKDVKSELDWTQRINQPGTTTTVQLARSVNTTTPKRDTLIADAGDLLTTIDGQNLVASYVTNNTVGQDTDVDLNYNVDVYVHYGGFETLETMDGQTLIAEDGQDILYSIGAPLGRRIFSGWIMDYTSNYGDTDGVEVTLASNGSELANQVINSSGTTTVTYTSTDHGQVIRNLLAMNTGVMGNGIGTVANTGATISPKFQLNSVLEGTTDVYRQSPDGWYWYGNVGDNQVYFQQKSATAQHTFLLHAHIGSLQLKKTIENLKNVLYFIGGNTGSGILYKKYTASSSVTRQGLDRQTDGRVTLAPTAQKRADKTFARYKDPIYTTTVTVLSEVYDIESIELGQVVTFGNFGNFIDGILMQIVAKHYTPYSIELELGELLNRQSDIINNITDTVQVDQFQTIPTAPS